MSWKRAGFILGCVGMLLLAALPARAQVTWCSSSPDAAVRCFVRNAVTSGLASVPSGMTMTDFKAYGVSVSNIVQTPPALVFLLGTMSAVADALPPTNADGSADQAAQDAAVSAIVDAGLKAGLISLPANTTSDQLKMFARNVSGTMGQYNGAAVSPGALLRFLDFYVISATSADGTVNWGNVQVSISSVVDSLLSSHLLTLPAGVSSDSVKQFTNDLSVAVHDYRMATAKAAL